MGWGCGEEGGGGLAGMEWNGMRWDGVDAHRGGCVGMGSAILADGSYHSRCCS